MNGTYPSLRIGQLVLVAALVLAPVAAAQPRGGPPSEQPDPRKATAPAAKKETPEVVRMKKLKPIQFDRRASSILKARRAKPPTKEKVEDPIDLELALLQRTVTLGDWAALKKWVDGLPEKDRKPAYAMVLESLLRKHNPRPKPRKPWEPVPPRPAPAQFREQNTFNPGDILGLADAAPHDLDVDSLLKLGMLLRDSLTTGYLVMELVNTLDEGTVRLGGPVAANRVAAAKLLQTAGLVIESGKFLPTLDKAVLCKDAELIDMIGKHALAEHAKEKKAEHLMTAWKVTQAVLALDKSTPEQQERAMEQALDLVPKLDEAVGRKWLTGSLTGSPERGFRILTTIGAINSNQRHERDAGLRMRRLELQGLVVEAVLKHAAKHANEWTDVLNLMATNWLREAAYATKYDQSNTRGPNMSWDQYGNIYYRNWGQSRVPGNYPQPIKSGKLLDVRPSEAWLNLLRADLRPKLSLVYAQLFLKVKEEEKAFPYIEQLAKTHPKQGLELANEFLDVWTANHDPNRASRRTNRYMYIYGYNPRSATIPLTRSKQDRNLRELSSWVKRLRALPIGELDETRLSKAFIASHSVAEVFRLSHLEQVFGGIDSLKPATLAEILHTMRKNLMSVWRDPRTQRGAKTKRKDKEIEREVIRGYDVAQEVLVKGLNKFPRSWALHLAKAALMYDQNSFNRELARSANYSAKRDAAFGVFAYAAALYANEIPKLGEDKEKVDVYAMWFYAGMGSSELAGVRHETPEDPNQPGLIRKAIMSLSAPVAERHMAKFANALSTRISAVKPEMKHRYLKHGLKIAGDHKQARDAKKLFDYYDDLVTEIRLAVTIDGPTAVGHKRPFGVFVDIRHTKEIERESGGFGKYLQNQNTGNFYNWGRPLVNYRDQFEEMVRESLQEQFEVLSVTFHSDKIKSRGDPERGWRKTPYAYLLLKAKGPEVDEIAPLHLNLDFMDTSGYCVLPVESSRIPVDCSPGAGGLRPVDKLKVIQTLDERKAAEGLLILEVRASAHGLIPELDDLLDVKAEGFNVGKIEDNGVSVVRMDPETQVNSVVSERNWTVELKADPDNPLPIEKLKFQFAAPKKDGMELTFQRYEDADMVEVGKEVALAGAYGERESSSGWIVGLALLLVLAVGVFAARKLRAPEAEVTTAAYEIPSNLTPFTVWELLRNIHADERLGAEARQALEDAITGVEQHYFNRGSGDGPDLRQTAEEWVRKIG